MGHDRGVLAALVLVGLVLAAGMSGPYGRRGAVALALVSVLWLVVNGPMEGPLLVVTPDHGLTGGDLAGLAGLGLAAWQVLATRTGAGARPLPERLPRGRRFRASSGTGAGKPQYGPAMARGLPVRPRWVRAVLAVGVVAVVVLTLLVLHRPAGLPAAAAGTPQGPGPSGSWSSVTATPPAVARAARARRAGRTWSRGG